jgi:conjugative relaxase-like TrwC/TraI family protein
MSLHKLSAGSGYTYLTRQVAAGDVTARGRGSLADYYAGRGESPGVWLGNGLVSLAGGPQLGDPVSEAQMVALFGHGHHPNADLAVEPAPGAAALGTPFITPGPRTSVAGYDLTFSPVKSVSALWALADPDVAAQIETAHAAAVTDVIGWLERTAVYTRLGTGGIRQVDVTGLLAVAFTHRDSRTGDPDLHTHVAISNKVRTLEGRWRALDGRPLHAAIVAASERYNTRLEAQLVDRLGVAFTERPVRPGARPVRELAGVPVQLIEAWSSRRARIVDADAALVDRFRASYGREPTRAERQALAQQATLATRPGKHGPRSLAEQRSTWREQAERLLSPGAAERIAGLTLHRSLTITALPAGWAQRAARSAVATVSAERAVFGPHHVRAELERLARADRIPLRSIDAAIDHAMTVARSDRLTIRVGGDPDEAVAMPAVKPAALRRRDGKSVYTTAHTELYTSGAVLEAERRVLAAADRADGRRVPAGLVELALLEARAAGHPLNAGQHMMVRELACSGRRVQVALAPAGTGKTTALGMLATAWTDAGGHVLGTAPSAVAAAALREATGQPAVTLAAALRSFRVQPVVANGAARNGGVPLGPGLLVLVDEAGMAATTDLAALVDAVTGAGGSVRLVGDTGQLSSPAAGGILRDLVRAHGATELDTPVRFTDPAEADATLAIRAGDPAGLNFYAGHGRIHTPSTVVDGPPRAAEGSDALDSALTRWAVDRAAGQDSLLLAGSNAVAAELNARARTIRLLSGGKTSRRPELRLRDGTAASAGDLVLARQNDRDVRIGGREWVKNGDRFTVLAVTGDGGLRVRHTSGRHLTLPACYVAEHVQLGYAATIHLAQGSTVDTTHTVLTGRESREQLYVALTRGRHANHLHLAAAPAEDDMAHPALAHAERVQADPLELVRQVLARSDQRPSASSALVDAADPGRQLHLAVQRYLDAHALYVTQTPEAGDTGATGGPLPWLPPPPDPDLTVRDGGQLAEYVQRRADLVHTLTAAITADHLPATAWVDRLREADPDLARRLALWRAATDVADHLDPLGPEVSSTPVVRAQLAAQLRPYLAADVTRGNAAARPAVLVADPAQGRDPRPGRVRIPSPERDPILARAYHRDPARGRGVHR